MQPDKQAFFAIGQPDNPRWLAPAGYRPRDESFLGWRPYRFASRLAWTAMKSAARWGATPAPLPDHNLYVRCIAGLNWRALGWRRLSEPEPLVYVGSPGPRRKAVVHLIDPASHACELIVKAPLTETAKSAIRHEAHTLMQLQQEGFSAAPRLVELDEAAGIASQTVVTGSSAGLKCDREVAMLLQALVRRPKGLTLRQMAVLLRSKLPRPESTETAATIDAALEQMDDGSELPAVRIHGDFAPWNIKLQNGAAALVDWEDSQPSGLPLHDACHFVHMSRCLFGKKPQPMWQELRFRYAFKLNAPQRRQLELAYLVQTLLRDFPKPEPSYATYLLATLRKAVAEHL